MRDGGKVRQAKYDKSEMSVKLMCRVNSYLNKQMAEQRQ